MSPNEPFDTETCQGGQGIRLQQTGEWEGSQVERGGCDTAGQQHQANHKGEGREEIRATLQEQNPSIRKRKQEMRSIPLLCSLQET